MLVFLKVLCACLFTSAVQIVERAQTVFRHLNQNYSILLIGKKIILFQYLTIKNTAVQIKIE